jgi:hypothetical protein
MSPIWKRQLVCTILNIVANFRNIFSLIHSSTTYNLFVAIVENNQTKFQIDSRELANRKQFVTDTKERLKMIKSELQNTRNKGIIEGHQREVSFPLFYITF